MNPLVAPHLDFLPEDAQGECVFKTSQSAKWLKHLDPDLRVQMVFYNLKHYYIYEPVQLKNDEIVIPIFFYILGSKTLSKCYKPKIKSKKMLSCHFHFSLSSLCVLHTCHSSITDLVIDLGQKWVRGRILFPHPFHNLFF
jgi:hypothetical protein